MGAKPLTFDEWCEQTTGAQLAATDGIDEIDDLDDFLERTEGFMSDEELRALGRKMIAAYYAYICSFIDALKS